jgi:uracil-DNA glycosylase
MTKEEQYVKLVNKRRSCIECERERVHPLISDKGIEFHKDHIGPWTNWQGHLDAELMVVGQEWGGIDNYSHQNGEDEDHDATNANLVRLINSISGPSTFASIGPPSQYQKNRLGIKGPHYFTNALLCMKYGKATHNKKDKCPTESCYRRCCEKFLTRQVEIVQPLVLVTLGARAYDATANAYDLPHETTLTAALKHDPLPISARTVLVPLFHAGYWGCKMRNKGNQNQQLEDWQLEDWQRVKAEILEGRNRSQNVSP